MPDTVTLKTSRSLTRKRTAALAMEAEAMVVRFRPAVRWTDEELFEFCQQNGALRIEQTAEGEVVIMPPVGWEGSHRNFNLYGPFAAWHERSAVGQFSDSSGGFTLPNGAMRSPDVAWVAQERLDRLTKRQWEKFLPLCPDFVLELRSQTDRLSTLQEKMAEYLANGARLGWLLDPLERQVFVHRPGVPVEHLRQPATLSGEPVLAGFTLDLARVW